MINWHDRSLAPERLWGGFYQDLIAEVGKGDRAWFATAGEAVDWFRWRRSFRFTSETNPRSVTVQPSPSRSAGPRALVRIHRPAAGSETPVEERRLDGHQALRLEF